MLQLQRAWVARASFKHIKFFCTGLNELNFGLCQYKRMPGVAHSINHLIQLLFLLLPHASCRYSIELADA